MDFHSLTSTDRRGLSQSLQEICLGLGFFDAQIHQALLLRFVMLRFASCNMISVACGFCVKISCQFVAPDEVELVSAEVSSTRLGVIQYIATNILPRLQANMWSKYYRFTVSYKRIITCQEYIRGQGITRTYLRRYHIDRYPAIDWIYG